MCVKCIIALYVEFFVECNVGSFDDFLQSITVYCNFILSTHFFGI